MKRVLEEKESKTEFPCETCKAMSFARWEYRTHTRQGVTADNVLCGVCEGCNQVQLLAAQAGHRFREETLKNEESRSQCRECL